MQTRNHLVIACVVAAAAWMPLVNADELVYQETPSAK